MVLVGYVFWFYGLFAVEGLVKLVVSWCFDVVDLVFAVGVVVLIYDLVLFCGLGLFTASGGVFCLLSVYDCWVMCWLC